MGGAIGVCAPLLGPAKYRGVQGAVQWKWSLLLQQTVIIQYCTSDWISTPLTLVDTYQVNDIWKDGLGRVSTVNPHWIAALFKSICQHAHAAVNWLSMSLSRHTCQISLAFPIVIVLHSITVVCPRLLNVGDFVVLFAFSFNFVYVYGVPAMSSTW